MIINKQRITFSEKTMDNSKNISQLNRSKINSLLKKGYSKSQLARSLDISRSTLISILKDKNYIPTKSTLGRIDSNIDWLEKPHGRELLSAMVLLYFQHKNVLEYFQYSITRAEKITGFKVGYHSITLGGPVGFMLVHAFGTDAATEFLRDCPFPYPAFGRTETLIIGSQYRQKSNHEQARIFYKKNPNARMYLKFFRNFGFTASHDLSAIQEILNSKRYSDSIFSLESGLITGEYDYFILILAKDEDAFRKIMNDTNGIYDLTEDFNTESKTLSITPTKIPNLFTPGHYNLSFNAEQIKNQLIYEQ